jgi:hypothetical protein
MSKNTNLSFLTDYITADITNGRIGINTPSPTVAFDVTGVAKFSSSVTAGGNIAASGTGNITIQVVSSNNFPVFQLVDNRVGGNAWNFEGGRTLGNLALRDSNAGIERMTWTSAGNVGIGTTSPTMFGGGMEIQRATQATLRVSTTTGTLVGGAEFGYENSVGAYIQTVQANGQFSIYTGNASVLAMRITNAGNVGIGTTTPDTKLQVTATGSTGLSIRTDTSGDAFMRLYRDSTIYAHWYADRTNSKVTFGSVESVPLTFDTAATERMRITSAGNVGIGTSAPSSALDVNGIITGRNVIRYNPASTTSVSTTTTIISTASNTYGGLAMIWGNDASGNIFTDFIFYSLSAISVLSSQTISGGPSSRTYTTNGSGSLRLAMGSGTYTVRYQGLLV